MKPLLLVELPDHSTLKDHERFEEMAKNNKWINDYDVLVFSNCKVSVHYPSKNVFKYWYYKIKAWATLKIAKKK